MRIYEFVPQNFLGSLHVVEMQRQRNAPHPQMRARATAVVTTEKSLYAGSLERHSRDVRLEVVEKGPEDDDFRLAHGACASFRYWRQRSGSR